MQRKGNHYNKKYNQKQPLQQLDLGWIWSTSGGRSFSLSGLLFWCCFFCCAIQGHPPDGRALTLVWIIPWPEHFPSPSHPPDRLCFSAFATLCFTALNSLDKFGIAELISSSWAFKDSLTFLCLDQSVWLTLEVLGLKWKSSNYFCLLL